MTPQPFVPLGRGVKSHGLKGEGSVISADDLPSLLPLGLEVWFVPPPKGVRSGTVESVRLGPKGTLVKITGVDDIDAAQALVGSDIVARVDDMPEDWSEDLSDGADPVGLVVTDLERGLLGTVTELIVTGANDVWTVAGPLGEVLLPVIDDVVLEVDWDAGKATVRCLPGLLPDAEDAE
jgi:16S rRNA processing protein RimM